MNEGEDAGRMRVFVSYSRDDLDFADQIVLALQDKGFVPLLDRHSIDGAEKWKERLSQLIFSCDTVVFILTATSASSDICRWEVEEAAKLGKRMIPVVPHALGAVAPPPALGDLNYIHFYRDTAIPGSGFYDGVQRLERALKIDLDWLRELTRLSERAVEWKRARPNRRSDDHLLRGSALAEAQAWLTRSPGGVSVLPLVSEYLDAGDLAESLRAAESKAQIFEREAALKQAEDAATKQRVADRAARRATIFGAAVSMLLAGLAIVGIIYATNATHEAAQNNAQIFAAESDRRCAEGLCADAIRIALAGDPAARRTWLASLMAPDGYPQSRLALAAALTHNQLERVFGEDAGVITSISMSRDGRRVVTVSEGHAVRLWDVQTGRMLQNYPHDAQPFFVALTSDGRRILTATDSIARLWDTTTGRELRTFRHAGLIMSGAFSSDGSRVFTGSGDGTARLWDTASGQLLRTLSEVGFVFSVAIAPDGPRLLTGSVDGSANLWDSENGSELRSFRHESFVRAVAFDSVWGGRAVTGGGDRTARLWDVESGRELQTFRHADAVTSVALNGRSVVTGSTDRTARVWDASNGNLLQTFQHNGKVWSVAFAPDGRSVLTGSYNRGVSVWNAETGGARETIEVERLRTAVFSHDGLSVLTGSDRWGASLLDPTSGRAIQTFLQQGSVHSVAFSPDDRRVLIGASDNAAHMLDAESGRELRTFRHEDAVLAAVFSPDGQQALTGSGDVVSLWDATSGDLLKRFQHQGGIVRSVAFAPDGQRILASSENGAAHLWEVASGRVIQSFEDEGTGSSIAFSPDGLRVLAATSGAARVWSSASGRPLQTFRHQGEVRSVRFSPDGRRALTGGDDGSARLWDVESGRELQVFQHRARIHSVDFAPDGRRVLTVSRDGLARIWDIHPVLFASADEQVRMACEALSRIGMLEFTDTELQRFPSLRGRRPCAG